MRHDNTAPPIRSGRDYKITTLQSYLWSIRRDIAMHEAFVARLTKLSLDYQKILTRHIEKKSKSNHIVKSH